MSFGADSIGAYPIAGADTGGLPSGQTLAARLARGEAPPLVNFVEIFGRSLISDADPGIDPIGAASLASIPASALGAGAENTLFLSDREWCGRPDDFARPNQLAMPVLVSAGDTQARGPIYPEDTRRVQQTVSSVRFIDADGFFSAYLRDNAIDGGRVIAFFGEEAGYSADHVVYFDALVKDYERDGKEIIVTLDTAQSLLDAPALTAKYTGGGGELGDSYLKDAYIPAIFGYFYNAEPVLEDYLKQSYRLNIGDIDFIEDVKDRGVPLTFDGRHFETYADYILADDPDPGYYCTGPNSRFRLGEAPAGVLTVDGRGSKLFGAFSATTRAILRFILGGGQSLGYAFDEATFGFLPDDEIGLYLDGSEEVTREEIANALLAPYLAWIDTDPAGRLAVARAQDPETGAAVDALTEDDILEGWRETPLANPVRLSQEVTWGRNWRPMAPSEIADPANQPLISVEEFNRLQREEEVAIAGDLSLIVPYPSAKAGPRLRGYFRGEQAAKDAAQFLFDFFGKAMKQVAVPVQTYRAVNMQRGRIISITHAEITGGVPKNMTLFEINPSPSDGITELVGVMKV
jgi:hypothetical protein